MTTQFVTSPDGAQIAYDVTGAGSALILLHGGGHNRRLMHEGGYVERLAGDFQVITIDIRGNGESDKLTDPTAYATEKHCQDILAVADACGVARFALWGFSYEGNIVRQSLSVSCLRDHHSQCAAGATDSVEIVAVRFTMDGACVGVADVVMIVQVNK